MTHSISVNFSECEPVNYLWPKVVDCIGIDRARRSIRQAIDLQKMQGNKSTLPVLISETCGLALVEIDLLRCQTGFRLIDGNRTVLILSIKDKLIQLLSEA